MASIKSTGNIFKNPIHFLAFGFGAGLSPIMPGTMGTLVAIPIYLLLRNLTLDWYLAAALLVTLIGIWLCHVTARDLKVHDHPGIVWDEIAGFLWTMFLAPKAWWWIVIGFVLFRFFDIVKPWPIRLIDLRVKGGLGIMLDDLLAAVYAWVVLHLSVALIML